MLLPTLVKSLVWTLPFPFNPFRTVFGSTASTVPAIDATNIIVNNSVDITFIDFFMFIPPYFSILLKLTFVRILITILLCKWL